MKKKQHWYEGGINPYSRQRWKTTRKAYIAKEPLCELCKRAGLLKAGEEIHHILPLEDGGSLTDFRNLQTLCRKCHYEETERLAAWKKTGKACWGITDEGYLKPKPEGVSCEETGEDAFWLEEKEQK